MKYNLASFMRRAWGLRREKGYTMTTALRLAWMEAKGNKGYAFRLEEARAQITAYLVKLGKAIADIHDQHKLEILLIARPTAAPRRGFRPAGRFACPRAQGAVPAPLMAALLLPVDAAGLAVTDGKTVGLCKYACRNA